MDNRDIHEVIQVESPKEPDNYISTELSSAPDFEKDNPIGIDLSKNRFQCKSCDKIFISSITLKCHATIHTERNDFKCSECNKAFRLHSLLTKHLKKVHTKQGSDTRYPCSECDKTFSSTINLKKHVPIHTGRKDFICNMCDKAFLDMNRVQTHKRYYCKESVKSNSCDQCPKKFSNKEDMEKHCITHTGEKAFQCDICNQAFSRAGNLKAHVNSSHFFQKAFECDLCDKTFTRANHIKDHMMMHNDNRPFVCETCGHSFRRKRHLADHTKSWHEPKIDVEKEIE